MANFLRIGLTPFPSVKDSINYKKYFSGCQETRGVRTMKNTLIQEILMKQLQLLHEDCERLDMLPDEEAQLSKALAEAIRITSDIKSKLPEETIWRR